MRLRPWQLTAALVTVCVFAILAMRYLRRDPDLSPQQMMSYLPQRDATMFYLDLRPLRDSGLLDKLAGSTVTEEAEYKHFVEKTGFDYKNDLDVVLSSTDSRINLFLLRGRFDWKAIMKYATDNGGQCYNGLCRIPGSKPDRIVSLYAVSRSLMALGVSEDGYAAQSVKAGASSPAFIPPVQPLWLSAPSSLLKSPDKLPDGTRIFAKALENAERVVFSVGPMEGRFELAMDVTCRTPQEAAVLRAQLQGLTGIVKKLVAGSGKAPAPAELGGILSAGTFETADRRVIGKWPVERAFLESLGGS